MLKIVIADDEPFFLEGLKVLIDWKSQGYEIIGFANNGEEALEKILTLKPDVVLTDLRMPEIEGLEIIRKCVKELRLKTKFIVISGYDDFSYAQKAMKYGVNHYILKPIDEETLISALREVCAEILKQNNAPTGNYTAAFPSAELLSAISSNDSLAIKEEINRILNETSAISLNSGSIMTLTNHLFVYVMKAVHTLGGDAGDFIENHHKLAIDAKDDPLEIEKSLYDFCSDCAQFIADLKLKQTNGFMGKIEQYIKENYHENINLKRISEVFYINPVYLGQLFSKHFNMYFHDYLTKIRIDEAKRLLRTTDLKVYEVADKVGFQNVDYFINKFKKRVNCTPLHYRSQSKTM